MSARERHPWRDLYKGRLMKMTRKKLLVLMVSFCMIITFVKVSVDTMAALDDVYYQTGPGTDPKEILTGSYWQPILVDGYYCDLSGPNRTIYATECKGKVLKFPTVIQYNHKLYKITKIDEKLEESEDSMYGYFPGYKNKELVTKIIIPNGIKKVELGELHTWKNLKEIRIPASVDKECLYLSHMKGKVVIDKKNKKYKTSGNGVYTKDGKKLKATFGAKKTFTVKKGTKSVEWEAFWYYKNLKKVTFPSSVKSVYLPAFRGCKNLKSITFQGKKAPSFGKKSDLKYYDINDEFHSELKDIPKKVTVYVKNKAVKKSIEKTLKIGNLKKLKWKVKVKK